MSTFDDWNSLAHHGIKGQKWGVRRYQNDDGTLTALGKLRGGKDARKENRILKKTISDDNKYSKEWMKERDKARKRAIKDDNYRKTVAELEAWRLNMDPEETKEFFDAHLAGGRAADNIMWYKYGDRGSKNIKTKIEKGEKIAKTILTRLEKKGLNIEDQGKHFQSRIDEERGVPQSGKNAFEGDSAKGTLYLLQAMRETENARKRKRRR